MGGEIGSVARVAAATPARAPRARGGRLVACAAAVVAITRASPTWAGPETALRELAGGQVKKGVRTIGMGGDGATTGNYALVYRDAGSAILDEGVAYYGDTGNRFDFGAVGFTSPRFWDDAALYVIALAQRAPGVRVWSETPASGAKPPSTGNLSDSSLFVKVAKPLSPTWSLGVMGAYELSDALLVPDSGAAPIRFTTSWRPSGGAGVHWHPNPRWQAGARVILNHDVETRTQGGVSRSGLLRAYEYRLGAAWSPWPGTLLDVGGSALDRSNGLEDTHTFDVHPTVGAEQAIVPRALWLRAGLDETTWTAGASVAFGAFKLDLAGLRNLAAARTGDVFGKQNVSVIATLGFDYEQLVSGR